MKFRLPAILLVLSCTLVAQQQKSVPARAPSQNAHETISAAPPTKDLAATLARMRALVQRMQSNLPAVASGQSPLEYEFQLQIEMWQVLMDQMERQIKAATPPSQ